MKGKILSLYAGLGMAAFLVGCDPAPEPTPPTTPPGVIGGPAAPSEGPGMSGPAPKVDPVPAPEGTPTPEPAKPVDPPADAPKPEAPQS